MKENFIETCSTIYHTPSGDIEVPDPGVETTYKSNLAPLWLVFPKSIINTKHITEIEPDYENKKIIIYVRDGFFKIPVSDVDVTWSALQKAFAEGVSNAK